MLMPRAGHQRLVDSHPHEQAHHFLPFLLQAQGQALEDRVGRQREGQAEQAHRAGAREALHAQAGAMAVGLHVERVAPRAPHEGALILRVAAHVRAGVEGLQVDEGWLLLAEGQDQLLQEDGHEEAQQEDGLGQRVVGADVAEAQDLLELFPHSRQQSVETRGQKHPSSKGVAERQDLFGAMGLLKICLDDLHGEQGAKQHEEEHAHHAKDFGH